MNVAGPSRRVLPSGRPAQRESVESTYEQDLLALFSQLGPDEMDEMQTFFTRRTSAGEPLSDHDVAMNDLLQQVRALAIVNEDRVLAQRVAAGEDVGAERRRPTIVQAPRAAAPGGGTRQNVNQQPAGNPTTQSQTWGGWFSSMVGWVFNPLPASEPDPSQTKAPAAAPKAPVVKRPTGHDCVICQDPIYGVEIRAACGHYYDVGCITDLFQSATKDETLYPPRCCRQNIPFAQVRPHLPQALLTTFQEKQAEFSTLKRVYCSSPTCSRFLGPLSEGIFSTKTYTCPAQNCGRRTCGKCREQYTSDWTHVCRPDRDAAQVLELSRASGWARCPGCSQMIELNVGCFHMTCRCRTEFCYLCRARWKTCPCPQWDERRLLAAAEERVDAQLGGARGVRRAVPEQRARPAPAPAPVVVPARRVPVVAHPPAVPRPAPVQRPATLVQPAAPVRVVAPPRPVAPARPQPTPTPAPQAVPSHTRRTVSTASTIPTRTLPGASTAASTSASSSSRTTPSMYASASVWGSASTSSSVQGSSSKSTLNTNPSRQRLIQEMMEKLRVDHECDHAGRWHYRSGGGICQSCGHRLPLYLFRCQGCDMLACNRCRRNRL